MSMTKAALKEDLIYLARVSGLPSDDLDSHVEFCIERGLDDFWNAHGWSWATKSLELEISSEAERYELPSDFKGIQSVREKTNVHGGPIIFVPKERFDREYPRPLSLTNNRAPRVCTAYYNRDDAKWYIQFVPIPESASTIYIEMYTTRGEVEGIGDGTASGLTKACEQMLYRFGPQRIQAQDNYETTLARLIKDDGPFKGQLIEIITGHIGPVASPFTLRSFASW